FINRDGKLVAANYSLAGNFSKGVAAARINDKWCFINKDGKPVTDIEFDSAEASADGVTAWKDDESFVGGLYEDGRLVFNADGGLELRKGANPDPTLVKVRFLTNRPPAAVYG